ncbi:MAG: hypothetical protein CVV61_01495 [Tenericutes bacterium HGW-Tenericutes-6]|jgi:chloramphenicol O-acetyltransferase type A|nr:MAG: hypothetical protein CVV61_01495 [Tenericutes bacterium HGW-Tenericutes-6]
MKKINIDTWDRKDTFKFYEHVDMPRYLMTFDLDVTNLYDFVKKHELSFYLSFMHQALFVMNELEAFRYRFIDNDVYLFDCVHPSFTDMIENTTRFKIVTCDFCENLRTFNLLAKEKSKSQGDTFIDMKAEERQDLVYITTFPWATYTQVSHAHNLNKKDAIPKLVWGKFKLDNHRKIMPFSIEVHHAFIDGYHLGTYINKLQERLNQL